MITQYIAEDGEDFFNEKDCARHELASCGVLEKLEAGIAKAPRSFQKNWCESGACACVGCINREFHQMGLKKSHWEVWMEDYRQDVPLGQEDKWDDSRDYEETNLILKNHGENKAEVVKIIRKITGLGMKESFDLLQPESAIKIAITYIDAKHYKHMFEKAGAMVEIREMPRKTIQLVSAV